MTRTEIERLTIIETKFETIIEPMAFKVDQIHDALPEMTRKVNKHHEVFRDHSEMLGKLEKAQCPAAKVMPEERPSDGNGSYLERRTKKPLLKQFKELPLNKKCSFLVIGAPFLGAYWEWIFDKAHSLLNWIEAIPK